MMTKGKMIKKLKEWGIRKTSSGKKLEHAKTFEIIKIYSDYCGVSEDNV